VERVVMTQDRPRFLAVLENVTDLAAGLGLPPEAIEETGLPAELVSMEKPKSQDHDEQYPHANQKQHKCFRAFDLCSYA
jgi:hypothetical protein